jgi:hypothetical protein
MVEAIPVFWLSFQKGAPVQPGTFAFECFDIGKSLPEPMGDLCEILDRVEESTGGSTNLGAVQIASTLRKRSLPALDQRAKNCKFMSKGRRGSFYAARASFHFNDGSSRLPAFFRYASAYVTAFSLPCSIVSTDSEGAIQFLALTL